MIDSANSVLQGIVNQIEFTYDEPDGTVIATENPELEDSVQPSSRTAMPNAAYAGQWSDDWNASMANGEFAAMLCPGWMLGVISGNAPDVTGWEIANAFPNGGGNWGGSYLTVPANGENVEAAQQLADWLTAPEQQIRRSPTRARSRASSRRFEPRAHWLRPTRTSTTRRPARSSPSRAEAVTVATVQGREYFKYHDALQNAITRVFDGLEDKDTSWDTYVAEVEAF